MRMTGLSIVLVIITVAMMVACTGEKQGVNEIRSEDYLIAAVDSIGLKRTSEPDLYIGDSLWQFINGGAELYHLYNFVEVATAYYDQEGTEIVVDIYRFDSPEHAFGLYSMLRPENAEAEDLGIEGFGSKTNLVFVKGVYVVMVTGFEQTDAVASAIGTIAPFFDNLVRGTTDIPAAFTLFPAGNTVKGTQKLHAQSFLGQAFLREVYSQRYVLGEDTVTLFRTDDISGAKYIEWKETSAGEAVTNLPYDEGTGMRMSSAYYGDMVAGLRGGKLIGLVGYSDSNRDFLSGWLESMPAAAP